MTRFLSEYFRCEPGELPLIEAGRPLKGDPGYFRFGPDIVCYGRTSSGCQAASPDRVLYDVESEISFSENVVRLPFDPDEVVVNLTHEKYVPTDVQLPWKAIRYLYYALRPAFPAALRSHLQRLYFKTRKIQRFPNWPVDITVDALARRLLLVCLKAAGTEGVPFIWFWPDSANGCAVMTHDVETRQGLPFCSELMDADDRHRIPASFQIVPENRYPVTPDFIEEIQTRGFEVNVQDLNHDGRLFWNFKEFARRSGKINRYARDYGAIGFRSAILYRRQEWFNLLDIKYDMSVPNVAHFDPQPGGCCTVKPFFVGDVLELPVTTSQDHTVFHVLGKYSLDLWKRQIELILSEHGLISFIIHPDYVMERRAFAVFRELLEELARLRSERNVWITHPGEVNRWWRQRAVMKVVKRLDEWVIEGTGSDRACLAFASIENDGIVYKIPARQPSA